MLNRGFHNEVNTFNNEPYDTRFSGNVIDICPVGALTNTDFRFKARTWDLSNQDTLCEHCGSKVSVWAWHKRWNKKKGTKRNG